MIFFQFFSIMILLLGIAVVLILEYFNINKFHSYVTILALLGSMAITISFILVGHSPEYFGIKFDNVDPSYTNFLRSCLLE